MIIKKVSNWYTSKRVTETTAVIGNTGYGKSYLVGKIEEKYVLEKWPFGVIDKMGIHYVIRNKFDSVILIGGRRGDYSLEEIDTVMPTIMEKGYSYIIDLSDFDDIFAQEFATDFFGYIYDWHKENRKPRNYMLEECDTYIGQTGSLKDCKRIIILCITKGRMNGIGTTLISQRFRLVDKTPLGQAKNFVIFNMKLPIDLSNLKNLVGEDVSSLVRRLHQGQCLIMTDEGHDRYVVGERKSPTVADTPEIGKKIEDVEILPLNEDIKRELEVNKHKF